MVSREEKLKSIMLDFISNEKYENGIALSHGKLPSRQEVQNWLESRFNIQTRRENRVILVEEVGNYKVFIQIPNGKSEYDFNVWYAKIRNGKLSEIKLPKHDQMFSEFKRLREAEEDVLVAVERLIENRDAAEEIASEYSSDIRKELLKFLVTLKWICLQEDANYPPPKMGSKYPLAAYVLLNYGFEPWEMRSLLRFLTKSS